MSLKATIGEPGRSAPHVAGVDAEKAAGFPRSGLKSWHLVREPSHSPRGSSAGSHTPRLRMVCSQLSSISCVGLCRLCVRPPCCRWHHQVPRVPLPDLGVTLIRETWTASCEDITPRSWLLQTHSSIPFGSPLLRPKPRSRSLCRLRPAPAAGGTFPTLSL